MRSSATSVAFVVALVASGAATYGCSSDNGGGNTGNPFTNAGSVGTAGTTPTAGVGTGGSGAGTGGVATGGGGAAGNMAGGMSGGGTPMGGMSGAGGGAGGGMAGNDITKVWKSDGCGKAAGVQSGAKITIPTKGMKDAACADKLDSNPRCGLWGQSGNNWTNDGAVPCPNNGDCTQPVQRDYYVNLPQGYDMNKAYPLVLEGPGCGGNGTNIYPLPDIANQVIRVGLTPPPNYIGHGTNEKQGCFDDKEGDDSVDWVFYENMYDALNAAVCFDRNRVFSAGNSSGSWFSNELGCKYAGDPMRPVRGVLPNTGGLPNEAQFEPTCTTKPMAGMWVHEINDPTNFFSGNKFAIDRALKVNGCTGATSYDGKVAANEFANFPIGGNNPDTTCQILKGCPDLYPLVVCPLPGNQHGGHDSVVNPGFATFIKQFSNGPFISQ